MTLFSYDNDDDNGKHNEIRIYKSDWYLIGSSLLTTTTMKICAYKKNDWYLISDIYVWVYSLTKILQHILNIIARLRTINVAVNWLSWEKGSL